MELIEIIDKNKNPTGVVKPRDEVHRKGYIHKTVHVWVVNKNNEILIQKRSKSKLTHPLMWDVSCAGHISAGDTSHETAVKELFEETGIKAEISELEYITSIERKYFHGQIKDHEIYDVFLIRKDFNLLNLKFDPVEVEELRLMDAKTFFLSAISKKDFIYNKEEYEIMEKILTE
ncbi:MAG: NUDIX domain-containing protein [Desulfobacteraceae bacterium]|nr:NUDIX domain-containing protein [Desulfobacteraceae bacterium]